MREVEAPIPHKALIQINHLETALIIVSGLSVLERNVRYLIHCGFEVTLLASEDQTEILEKVARNWSVLVFPESFRENCPHSFLSVAGDVQYSLNFFRSISQHVAQYPAQSLVFVSSENTVFPVSWIVKNSENLRVPLEKKLSAVNVDADFQGQSPKQAQQQLAQKFFDEIYENTEGWVARGLNKRISFALTRWLVRVPVTPNQISVFCFGVGVLGCLCLLSHSWGTRVVGALLIQANSVLDGCDGEVARLKVLASNLGAWLDTVFDDVLNNVMYLCLVVGYYGQYHHLGIFRFGLMTACASLGVSFFLYHDMIMHGTSHAAHYRLSWEVPTNEKKMTLQSGLFFERFLKPILKRDFFILFVLVMITLDLRLVLIVLSSVIWIAFFLYLASFVHGLVQRRSHE